MGFKKIVVLDLDTKVTSEASRNEKLMVKQIVTKFYAGKTYVYNILKAKSGIK
jgi:hypothetical protein